MKKIVYSDMTPSRYRNQPQYVPASPQKNTMKQAIANRKAMTIKSDGAYVPKYYHIEGGE